VGLHINRTLNLNYGFSFAYSFGPGKKRSIQFHLNDLRRGKIVYCTVEDSLFQATVYVLFVYWTEGTHDGEWRGGTVKN
jgi:hypothetical protein